MAEAEPTLIEEVDREASGPLVKDPEVLAIAAALADEIQAALDDRADLEAIWKRFEDTYDGVPDYPVRDYPIESASNVVVQLAAIFTDSMVARIMQSIFTVEPLWSVVPRSRTWTPHAKPLERYLDFARSDLWDQAGVSLPFVTQAVKLGTAVMRVGWRDETHFRFDEETRTTVPSGRDIGPSPVWVSLRDFVVPAGFADHQSAPWTAERIRYSVGRLRELVFSGYLEDLETLLEATEDEDLSAPSSRRRRPLSVADRQSDSSVRTLCLVHFRKDLDGDGYPEPYEMVVHLGRRSVHRVRALPTASGLRPYAVARFVEREGDFYGIGIPEMIEDLQREASTIHNERRDNAHMANIRMYKSSTTARLPETIRVRQGRNFRLLNPQIDLQEFRVSDNRQSDAFEEQIVTALAERRTGVSELFQGRASSPIGRAAATSVMVLLQEGAQRFDLSTSSVRRALGQVATLAIELFQVYGLPEPEDPGSPEQVLDPEPAGLVRALVTTRDDIRGIVKLRVAASTSAVNREVEKQSSIQLYGVITNYLQQIVQLSGLATSPQTPPEVRETVVRGVQGLDGVLRRIFSAHATFDLEDVLVGDLLAEMAARAPAQNAPEAVAPPGNGGLGELSGLPEASV